MYILEYQEEPPKLLKDCPPPIEQPWGQIWIVGPYLLGADTSNEFGDDLVHWYDLPPSGEKPKGKGTTSLETALYEILHDWAEWRIDNDPKLCEYALTILDTDIDEIVEHLQWVCTAPTEELLEWAKAWNDD